MPLVRIILGTFCRPRVTGILYLVALSSGVYHLVAIDGVRWAGVPWWIVFSPLFLGGAYVYWQLETGVLSALDEKIMYLCAYIFIVFFLSGALGWID